MIVASLPMYDWPEIRSHTDEFWNGFAKHARLDGGLERSMNHTDVWRQADLIFSQSCGYPFTHEFNGLLDYVATPLYKTEGCDGPNYCSIVFAREAKPLAEFHGANVAINTQDSMSGMLALKLVFAPFLKGGEFFRRCKISGSHRNSLAAVRNRYADICAVDAVCVGLVKRYCPQELEGLVEVARSPMVPSLPYVTRAGDPSKLVTALEKTFFDPSLSACREALLLGGFQVLGAGAYDRIIELESTLPEFTL